MRARFCSITNIIILLNYFRYIYFLGTNYIFFRYFLSIINLQMSIFGDKTSQNKVFLNYFRSKRSK